MTFSARTTALAAALLILLATTPAVFAGEGSITLFHTNDTHASFVPSVATWKDDKPLIGGFEALQWHLSVERERSAPSLYLDAGDFMTGNPISNIEYGGTKGGALVELFNRVGLDAMALGNHEFDQSRKNILAQIRSASFPVLAANLRGPDGKYFTGKGYVIREVGGVRVGIIGLTPNGLEGLISETAFEGLEVTPAVEALNALVPEVDAKSDLIVALSHLGIGGDRVIAREVKGIDVIIGGHSHTRLDRGEWVGDVLIAQAGSKLRYLGVIDLTVNGDHVTEASCRLVPLWAADVKEPVGVTGLIRRFEENIDREYGQVIARSDANLGRSYYAESDLGNWVTDGVRRITGADVAFLNSGGLRKNLRKGDVKKLDIQEILPFSNALCTFTCTGAELIEIIEENLAAAVTEDHGILQSSGLLVRWGRAGNDVYVVNASLVGPEGSDTVEVDPEKRYTVATVDYVARSQPEKYLGFRPDSVRGLGEVLTEAIMADVEKRGVITKPAGRRMIQEKSVEPSTAGGDAG